MKLELRKNVDGTNFVICVCSEKLGRQIVVPLTPALSTEIQRLHDAEHLEIGKLIVPRRPAMNGAH